MEIVKSSELKTGSAQIYIPPNKKYHFRVDGNITLTDQNGLPIDEMGKSPGIINIESTDVWSVSYQETQHHPADDIPVEVDMDAPQPDILTRMKELIRAEVMNRYGADSQEVETLEESMNFDIDGDGVIGSPYEVTEPDATVEPEIVIEPTPDQPAPEPAPEPAPAPAPSPEPTV